MTSSAGILLALLLFPLTVWLIIFDRLPSGLTSLFSSPIDADRLKAAALLRAQPDPFDDEERPAWSPSPRDQLEARTVSPPGIREHDKTARPFLCLRADRTTVDDDGSSSG